MKIFLLFLLSLLFTLPNVAIAFGGLGSCSANNYGDREVILSDMGLYEEYYCQKKISDGNVSYIWVQFH